MVYTLRVFLFKNAVLFHNSNVFGFCITHNLYTGCAKIKKKNNSGARRFRGNYMEYSRVYIRFEPWKLSQNTFENSHRRITLTTIEITAVSVLY